MDALRTSTEPQNLALSAKIPVVYQSGALSRALTMRWRFACLGP